MKLTSDGIKSAALRHKTIVFTGDKEHLNQHKGSVADGIVHSNHSTVEAHETLIAQTAK